MVQCAITNCRSRSDVHSKLTSVNFHRIPKDVVLRNKWMKAINNYNVHEYTRICSRHFRKKNYYKTKNGLDRLISTAVPDVDVPGMENVKDSSESDLSDEEQILEPNLMKVEQIAQHSLNDSNQETEEVKVTTVNVLGSDIKSNVQIYKHISKNQADTSTAISENTDEVVDGNQLKAEVKKLQLLEKKLRQEMHNLQLLSRKRLEKIISLQEENKNLLKKNEFLNRQLKRVRVPEEVNEAALQDSNFFMLND